MTNPLHRKKLRLSLRAIDESTPQTANNEPYTRMDIHQVLRWLDDIGRIGFWRTFKLNK
jgi:hypothetical protein